MSTIATTNVKHASSSSNNIVLNSDGTSYIPGHIVQVVNTVSKTRYSQDSLSSGSFTNNIMTAQITPKSSSSKILITGSLTIACSLTAATMGLNIYRDQNEDRILYATFSKLYAINAKDGKVSDMLSLNIVEPVVVKEQIIKAATEAASMILRIDDVIAISGAPGGAGGPPGMG